MAIISVTMTADYDAGSGRKYLTGQTYNVEDSLAQAMYAAGKCYANDVDVPIVGKSNPLTGGIQTIAKLTQAQYDAIAVKDDSTLYVIVA